MDCCDTSWDAVWKHRAWHLKWQRNCQLHHQHQQYSSQTATPTQCQQPIGCCSTCRQWHKIPLPDGMGANGFIVIDFNAEEES
jgi:hypothetical protein